MNINPEEIVLPKVKRNRKEKEIGDVTSMTIPKYFKDVITGVSKPVTKELLDEINLAMESRALVHLFMTGVSIVSELRQLDDLKSYDTECIKNELKNIDELLEISTKKLRMLCLKTIRSNIKT
ncbi:hypothetical protein [Paenibacillus polymyxa]|uniref:hypothetical protein n=1 Tax=Paenibacillus polymyxa TaxID=1406 RepID=UPI0025B6895A|nr:hypothetical protein [Paenibacillus polymyxa]MDN4090874.1 hypothetical protein [Paenibacillus polymyxa]